MTRKSFLFAVVVTLLLGFAQTTMRVAMAQSNDLTQKSKQSIVELLKRYRRAAENADADQYFDCLDKEAIFFGTDGKERFTLDQLKAFLDPYFSKGIGWKHEVRQRHVYVGPNNQIGWFDEQTQRVRIGPMRTTGVVKKTGDGWKIIQYNVSIVVPNEAVDDVVAIIRKTEEKTNSKNGTTSNTVPMSDEQRKLVEESFDHVWQKNSFASGGTRMTFAELMANQ